MSTTSNFLQALFAVDASPSVIAVGAYIASYGEDEVYVSDASVASSCALSTKSVQRARAFLEEKGLIEVGGGRGKRNLHKWTLKVDNISGQYKWTSPPQKTELKPDEYTESKSGHSRACAKKRSNNILNNNSVEEKKSSITTGSACTREKVGDLGLEIDEPKRKRKVFQAPILEEVRAYFGTRKAIIPNWFDEAANFYNYYDGIDWQAKPGVHITKWKTRADTWIERTIREQNKSQAPNHNEKIYDISTDPSSRMQQYAEGITEMFRRDREEENVKLAY